MQDTRNGGDVGVEHTELIPHGPHRGCRIGNDCRHLLYRHSIIQAAFQLGTDVGRRMLYAGQLQVSNDEELLRLTSRNNHAIL